MEKNKNVTCRVYIHNVHYKLEKYTVVRATNHEFWFYGTYDELDRAIKVAESVPNGYILQTKGVR